MARQAPIITSHLPEYLGNSPASTTPRSIVDQSFDSALPHQHKLTINNLSDDRLADTLAHILQQFCEAAPIKPRFPDPRDPAALFFSPYKQQSFTLNFYCKRLLQFNSCSKPCFPLALVYLIQLSDAFPIFQLNDFNVHRLFCTALVLAAKWQDDVSYTNTHYAKVGGIQTCAEMNYLELHMLSCLDYRLFVSDERYHEIENHILEIALSRT